MPTMQRLLNISVWHPGYTCRVFFRCGPSDLVNVAGLRARMALALFDHGVSSDAIERVRKDTIYHVYNSTLTPVTQPWKLPDASTIALESLMHAGDPEVLRVQVGDGIVLPVQWGPKPLKTIHDIEQHIRRRMWRYGVQCGYETTFYVHRARWTMSRPTRRSYCTDVVTMVPGRCNEASYIKAASVLQLAWRTHKRHTSATKIQRMIKNAIGDWLLIPALA